MMNRRSEGRTKTLPAPNKKPVKRRRGLVEVQKPKYCREPSTIKGRSITMLQGSE
jgi:hypothetical protein